MGRTVTLAAVDAGGRPLGMLPPFEVDSPYWPETADVVAGALDRYGVDVVVLRLLSIGDGGAASYLVETAALPSQYAGPVTADMSPQPLRAAYAEPGGPAAAIRWATAALAGLGRGPVTGIRQMRTWNLSAVWRLGNGPETAWLKVVPGFFAHEPTVLRWLADRTAGLVPALLAADGCRMLLEHAPGEDLHGAGLAVRAAIADHFHPVQLATAADTEALVRAGVPDGRGPAQLTRLTELVARHGNADPRLHRLIDGLSDRLAEVTACGLPDTLVHGDLHPGNVRGLPQTPPAGLVVIDWGDSFVGHPGFDALRLAGGLEPAEAETLLAGWAAPWRAAFPGSDPERAVRLLRPVAALRLAAVYADFLAQIEPAEHPYHRQDVPDGLALAADLAGAE